MFYDYDTKIRVSCYKMMKTIVQNDEMYKFQLMI